MAVTVYREVPPQLAQAIARFLAGAPGSSLEHDPRWLAVLEEALGHQPALLVARSEPGAITGCLPLALVRSPLFGRRLVSLPYVNRGGIVAQDAQAADALFAAAVNLARAERVRYLELRHDGHSLDHPLVTHTRREKVVMVLDLPETRDALWQAIPSKVRNLIRKGQRSSFTLDVGGVELLEEFYSIFAVNMRDLGTPVYPRRLFESILTHFAGEAELVLTRCEGAAVAGALLLHDTQRQITQVPSASCLRQFNPLNANMWMYSELLSRAIDRGAKHFDFGRTTPGSGPHRFKKQWGAQPRETPWQYHCITGDVGELRPDHPSMQRRIQTWQRLPVWLTRLVGPQIVRGIP